MDNIKWYTIDNREIAITDEASEELRILLQTEHLRKTINELIDERSDCFSFSSPASRRSFVDAIVRMNDDCINYDSSYFEEMLTENIFRKAEEYCIAR